jgi:hypothetical protein
MKKEIIKAVIWYLILMSLTVLVGSWAIIEIIKIK